jgi:hypothetical protein
MSSITSTDVGPHAEPFPEPLDDSRSGRITSWVRDDPQLAAECSAAVDALEVAARLETHGMSSRVAVDSFGYPDVFSAADTVYAALPFVAEEPEDPPSPPMGGPLDLLRGALYALPALFLPVVVAGFALHTRWWVLPIGLTVAWGVGQASATCAWALRGRKDHRSDALVPAVSIVVSAALCLGLAALATWTLGGNTASTVLAVGVAAYLAASGTLLFQQSEWLLAACMLPAALGSLLSVAHLPVTVSQRFAAWAVVTTVVLVVASSNRWLPTRRWRRPVLSRSDRVRAVKFLGYGIGCGMLISVFIGFAGELDSNGGGLIIAVWPLLLTLGLMEWQLRSFRSRATAALATSFTFMRFSRRVQVAFLRSVGLYVVALGVLSVIGTIIGYNRHAADIPVLVGSVAALGVSFFLALLLVSSGRITLVLLCWAATLAALAAELGVTFAISNHITPVAGLTALLGATVASIVLFSVLSSRVLTSPLSY